MGAWGTGLYANDTTCDVRDTYMEYLQDQLDDQSAYEKIMREFSDCVNSEDEAPLFWYALAETQWKTGRLTQEVRDMALDWITKGGGLELWEESPGKGAGWKKTLDKLKEKLESPVPKRKNIRKPKVVDENLWNLNDLYAYQFPAGKPFSAHLAGKYIVLQKIGEDNGNYYCSIKMRIHAYDKLFDHLPTVADLDGVRILPFDLHERLKSPCGVTTAVQIRMNVLMLIYMAKDYPRAQLTFIGNRPAPPNVILTGHARDILDWANIGLHLSRYYEEWHGVEYEDLGNGIYRYIDP